MLTSVNGKSILKYFRKLSDSLQETFNFVKLFVFLKILLSYSDIFIMQSGLGESKAFYSIDITCGRLLLLFPKP